MHPIFVPLKSQSPGVSGGLDRKDWFLSDLATRRGNAHLYVVGAIVDATYVITSAGDTDIVAFDFPLLHPEITLRRGSGIAQYESVHGWDMFIHAALTNRGNVRQVLPASITDTSANTRRVRWYYPVGDDGEACHPDERFARAWPLAAYASGGKGVLSIACNPVIAASITWNTGTTVLTPYLVCVLRSDLRPPDYDIRYSVVTAGTGSVKGLQFEGGDIGAGAIDSMHYSPYEIGGAEALTDVVIRGNRTGMGHVFDDADLIGRDVANAYTLQGLAYDERWLQMEGRNPVAADANNVVVTSLAVPLWGYRRGTRFATRALPTTPTFTLDVDVTTALTNGHRFMVGRQYAPDARDVQAMHSCKC